MHLFLLECDCDNEMREQTFNYRYNPNNMSSINSFYFTDESDFCLQERIVDDFPQVAGEFVW